MKNRILALSIIVFLISLFIVFYIGLNKSNLYKPKNQVRTIPKFSAESFFSKEKLSTQDIFNKNKFYLVNIWASWCKPCRDEHAFLIDLSEIPELEIIGLNYRDNFQNAKQFMDDLGNPFTKILIDKDGTKAIEWGAFGVPENFLVYENKIVKRFIGPIDDKNVEEIKKFLYENN